MSRAEAQARYLAALAAQAYSEEQIQLVSDADIVDGSTIAELVKGLGELPADEIKSLVQAMVTDPSMLGDETLAQLASALDRHLRHDGGPGPVTTLTVGHFIPDRFE